VGRWRPINIVVFPQSYVTVRGFVDYLHDTLEAITGAAVGLKVVPNIGEARLPPQSVAFFIGFRFPPFQNRPSLLSVFLNFSVLYPVRGLFSASIAARRWMRDKRKKFLSAAPGFDLVLDFYPAHAERLATKFPNMRVGQFPTNVRLARPETVKPIGECRYDVC